MGRSEADLADLTFMAAKTQAGMVHGLLEDLERPEGVHSLPGVALARQAVSQSLAALMGAPDLSTSDPLQPPGMG